MSQTTINAAIQRFEENENRVDIFANQNGFYSTNTNPVKNIETLPSFIARMIQRYITLNFKGDWTTGTIYQVNELVKESSIIYICVFDHTSGTFTTDLSGGKWAVYQGVTSHDLESLTEGYGVDLVGRAMKTLFEVDDLDTTSPLMHSHVYVRCFQNLFDGGDGPFDWDEASEATPVRGMIHQVTGVETGRWIRQFTVLYAGMFGTVGDGSTLNTTALQAALNYAGSINKELHIKNGVYVTGKLNWPSNNIKLVGEGSAMGYTSLSDPKTVLKAAAGTSIVLDLVQTGTGQDREGNVIQDIMIDGNNIASVGIDVTLSTMIHRCKITRCLTSGIRMSTITNSIFVDQCHIYGNAGYGIQVEGPSSTILFITRSYIGLNTLGGIYAEGGNGSVVRDCVIESNAGPGFRIYKTNTNVNYISDWSFEDTWIEDNASTSGTHVLEFDAGITDILYGPANIKFTNCHMSVGTGRKLANFRVVNGVTFRDCTIQLVDTSDTSVLAYTAGINICFINCRNAYTNSAAPGFSEVQELAFMASSGGGANGNYFHDSGYIPSTGGYKIHVGVGANAPAFQNSWTNAAAQAETAFWYTESGELRIQGCVSGGVSGTVVFTLPAGYRPPVDRRFAIDSNAGYGYIDIAATTGTVTITGTGAGTRSSFDVVISMQK